MVWRKLGKFLLLGSAGVLVTILLLLLGIKLALDRVPRYQAEIKDWVHARTGYHIAFAHVSPAFRWYGPELYFDRFELRSKDDRRVLARAAGGRIGADLWLLLRNGTLFAARIELDAPDIVITRLAPQRFSLASEIELGGAESSLSGSTLDDLPAGRLVIRHGRVTLQDWNAATPRLELQDVDLTLTRGIDGARLAVSASLPAVLGGAVKIEAAAHGGDSLQSLAWTAQARGRDLAFAGWRQLLPEYLSRLGGGSGGFKLTAAGRGPELRHAELNFDAAHVVTQLTDEPAVTFDQISGVLALDHAGDRWTLRGRRVRTSRAGRLDPDAEFEVDWRGAEAGLLELRARASYLRAETLLPLAGLLPQKDLRERLQEIAPTGEWTDSRVSFTRIATDEPWKLDVQARFRGVGFAPSGRAPGLRGLSGTLAGSESGGRVDIDTEHAVFNWPAQFSQAVDLEHFKTTLFWKRGPAEFLVATPSLAMKNRDATFTARVAWHQPLEGGSPLLSLAGSLDDGNVADTHLYLPHALLAPSVLAWLNRAFPAGHLSHADIVFQGPVRHFPFRDGSGVFLARAYLDGLTLDYREDWPKVENLAFVAEFCNEGLTATLRSPDASAAPVRGSPAAPGLPAGAAQVSGPHIGAVSVQSADARFVDFKTAELQLHVTAAGDSADALGYLRATPLDAIAEHAFSGVEAKGPMQAEISLFLPFKQFDQRRTLVQVHLHGVSLNRPGSTLAATELNGDAEVEGAQVSHADVRGKVLGGSFQMQARAPRNRPVTRTLLTFNGTFTGAALRDALSLPPSVSIEGASDWHAVLRMVPEPARERVLRISSSLAGLELNLPEPLAKPAARPLPSSLEVQWLPSGGPEVRLALGAVLRGRALLDSDASGPTVKHLSVAFGATPLPDAAPPGDPAILNTGGSIERLDLAGWLRLYTPDPAAKPLTNFLRSAKFEVARIDYLGLSFLDVSLDLAAADAGWRIGIGGPNVSGSIVLPGAAAGGLPWRLEFQRLKFVDQDAHDKAVADSNAAQAGSATAGTENPGAAATSNAPAQVPPPSPRGIPSIDFHAADMIWGDRQLGDVRATLKKVDDGISLEALNVSGASFTANAKGEWRGKDAGVGRIEGAISSTDVQDTLKRLGYADVVEARTGKLDFDLSWSGAPSGDALSAAVGRVQVALDKGQITGIKPGAGRVVGLTSLAALPRRLALDFSDLTDKGLAFDTVRGDFDLREGSAYTDDVLLKGPAAEIGLIGRVGLKSRDYDQTAVVTGNVGSTLPLAAFVAGPVIGGAVLLFTQVFKQPLKGLARGYYRITGNWDNPTVERIKSTDAAAASAEAPR